MKITVKKQTIAKVLIERFTSIEGIFQFLPMVLWSIVLNKTNSYYEVYLIIGILGIIGWFLTDKGVKIIFDKSQRAELLLSVFFSFIVIAANYELFLFISNPYPVNNAMRVMYNILHYLIYLPTVFFGGVLIFYYIFHYADQRLVKFSWSNHDYRLGSKAVFFAALLILFTFYSSVLVFGFYPGILTKDSVVQIEQIISGNYSNHHPVYHTFLIKLFFKTGCSLFNNINAGVLLYSLFSVLLMASAFAYSIVTLYKMKMDKKGIIAVLSLYAFLPCHFFLSFTMWKDVPFSACVLIFTVSMFRYFSHLESNRYLCVGTALLSALGIGLFRTNGLLILVILTIVFAVFFGKSRLKMCIALACVTVVAFVMMRPMINVLGIQQPDTIELMSIPAQQIARTVKENNDLTSEEMEQISKIVDIEEISRNYLSYVSDPVKEAVRRAGKQQYLEEHKLDYAVLYIKLGFSHPDSYFKAWVDQTKGYWNSGYNYRRWKTGVYPNDYNIKRTVLSRTLNSAIIKYSNAFDKVVFLRMFVSIGLQTWLILFAAFIGYKRKDKFTLFLVVPCLSIVLSLIIAAPIFSEIRYSYPLFCCLPFLTVIAYYKSSKKKID